MNIKRTLLIILLCNISFISSITADPTQIIPAMVVIPTGAIPAVQGLEQLYTLVPLGAIMAFLSFEINLIPLLRNKNSQLTQNRLTKEIIKAGIAGIGAAISCKLAEKQSNLTSALSVVVGAIVGNLVGIVLEKNLEQVLEKSDKFYSTKDNKGSARCKNSLIRR
jgi:hypothetical protein